MKRFLSLRAGFSLVEVNMAIFVLAGGALALLGLFPLGLRESNSARNEMRTATFAEKFLGAAQAAAQDLKVVTDDDPVAALADAIDVLGVTCDIFDSEISDSITTHKDDSGVWYQAWVLEDSSWSQLNRLPETVTVVEVGIRVTADNADQNPYALEVAPTYSARLFLDGRN